jgi:signal transduction histidine kinase
MKGAYAFRVLGHDGSVVAEHNGELLRAVSPWSSGGLSNQDFWLVNLAPGRRLHVAGGRRQQIGQRTALIEVATLGDPEGTSLSILTSEIFDDVWMPMIPVVVLTLGVAVTSVRRSLRPLAEMAALADHSSPPVLDLGVEELNLPREVASFVTAINGLLARVQALLSTQRALVARAAHELRTPLAAMMLEVERVEEHGTARLQADIKSLSILVDKLLTLARLEIKELATREPVDLAPMAEDAVHLLKPLVDESGHAISVFTHEPTQVVGDATAIYQALRNLIENAVRHTPPGTRITVNVGPGSLLSVEDEGPGWGVLDKSKLLEPFAKGSASAGGTGLGLSIVKEAAEMLGAELSLGESLSGGARVSLKWDSAEAPPAA